MTLSLVPSVERTVLGDEGRTEKVGVRIHLLRKPGPRGGQQQGAWKPQKQLPWPLLTSKPLCNSNCLQAAPYPVLQPLEPRWLCHREAVVPPVCVQLIILDGWFSSPF